MFAAQSPHSAPIPNSKNRKLGSTFPDTFYSTCFEVSEFPGIFKKSNCTRTLMRAEIVNVCFFIYSIKNLQDELPITIPNNYSTKHNKDDNTTGSNRL